jgi:protease-4
MSDDISNPSRGGASDQALAAFVHAYMDDRRRERRWRWITRGIWIGLLALFVWSAVSDRRAGMAVTEPHTALVDIQGEIGEDQEANADDIMAALRDAFEAKSAQAVVLRISSPGGSPVQAGLINDEIRRLKKLHHKKIYAVCEEMCASAAYYVAVAADQIFVDKASIVGSIGVLMDGFGFTGTMEKLGVERRLLTSGRNKGMLDPFSPMSDEQRAYAQTMLDQIHEQFIGAVRAGRGARLKENADTFSGLFWTGQQAVQMGLADHLGSLDEVARDVVKAEDVVDYTQKENVAEKLAKKLGASMADEMLHTASIWPHLR